MEGSVCLETVQLMQEVVSSSAIRRCCLTSPGVNCELVEVRVIKAAAVAQVLGLLCEENTCQITSPAARQADIQTSNCLCVWWSTLHLLHQRMCCA